uniref:Uncharacterized protein n=1 Tax=Kalanchoe fedtschenkoi TaxID=63787 RepID=A0A7N0UE40_KALFE
MDGYTSLSTKEPSAIDLEAGGTLYPGLSHGENLLRWGFIRKVYGILAAQLVLTTIVSSVFVFSPPVNDLLRGSPGLMLFLIFLPLVRMPSDLYIHRSTKRGEPVMGSEVR